MSRRIEEKRRQRERNAFIRNLLKQPVTMRDATNSRVPTALASTLALARQQFSAGQNDDCDATCRRILADDSSQADALLLFGICCHRAGDHGQAIDLLKRALLSAPDNPECHANLGVIYGQVGRFDEAIYSFRESLKWQPDNLQTLNNLGYAYISAKMFTEAVGVFETAIALNPNIGAFHLNRGGTLQMLDRLDDAEASYRKAISLQPDSTDAWYNLGTVLGRLRRYADSLKAYEKVLALSPDHVGALKIIGETQIKTGDNAKAAVTLRRIVQLVPDDLKARFDLAHSLALAGETNDAVAVCEDAIAMKQPTPDNLITLAVTYLCNKDPEAALRTCNAALSAQPGMTAALAFKSTALNELQRFTEAQYILDTDSLIQCTQLTAPEGYRDIDAFNEALCHHIRNHPTLDYSASNRSLKNGQATLKHLLNEPMGPFEQFQAMILQAIECYKAEIQAERTHPFFQARSSNLQLEVWANIMDTNGFHDTHFHPTGWLSGTYYPKLPAPQRAPGQEYAGGIEFGRSLYSIPTRIEPRTRVVQPNEGMLVLFPSYFGHRTLPFSSKEKRYSIAFDATPC